jgi:DNA-directed RNA polymerase subunit beta
LASEVLNAKSRRKARTDPVRLAGARGDVAGGEIEDKGIGMAQSMTGRFQRRRDFGRIPPVIAMPNLIEVQRASYDQFLQHGVLEAGRTEDGLQGVFKSVFPIRDFSDRAELHFVRYQFEEPKYDTDECQQRGMTYAAPLKVTLQLWIFDVDDEI